MEINAWQCQPCGRRNALTRTHCRRCGSIRSETPVDVPLLPTPKKSRMWLGYILGIIALLLITLFFIIVVVIVLVLYITSPALQYDTDTIVPFIVNSGYVAAFIVVSMAGYGVFKVLRDASKGEG